MRVLFFSMILLCSNLIAGTIDPYVPDSKYVEYGKQFPNVVQIMAIKENVPSLGSAVVIKPNWAITSAHIVDGDSSIILLINENYVRKVSKIIIHKSFSRPKTIADLALVRLDKEMDFDSYPQLYADNDELNLECSVSGYGRTGTFLTGAIKNDGLRRAGKNKITSINNITKDMLIFSSREDKSFTDLDFLIAGGDSGGGLFIDGKLAGINCCILFNDESGNADYGDDSGFMRISRYREWILENIEE